MGPVKWSGPSRLGPRFCLTYGSEGGSRVLSTVYGQSPVSFLLFFFLDRREEEESRKRDVSSQKKFYPIGRGTVPISRFQSSVYSVEVPGKYCGKSVLSQKGLESWVDPGDRGVWTTNKTPCTGRETRLGEEGTWTD